MLALVGSEYGLFIIKIRTVAVASLNKFLLLRGYLLLQRNLIIEPVIDLLD